MKKELNFLCYDEQFGTYVIVGDKEGVLAYIWSYLAELKDGEEIGIGIKRHDMTEEEIQNAPEIS